MQDKKGIHKKISIIGIGEDGYEPLSIKSKQLLSDAKVIFSSRRHFNMLPFSILKSVKQEIWSKPFHKNYSKIWSYISKNPIILSSGDPMFFGVGSTLIKIFGKKNIDIYPTISSISLAASRIGWSLSECDIITLHGRSISTLQLYLRPHGKIILLSENEDTPFKVVELLCKTGFDQSSVSICQCLGGVKERVITNTADIWLYLENKKYIIDPLNLILIDLKTSTKKIIYPVSIAAGLPDECYIHDGLITKSEIRAQTISSLAPFKNAILWDLGAGCGSISIEWMRLGGQAIAIEKNKKRCAIILNNALRLGIPNIIIKQKNIKNILSLIKNLPNPDAIFIGGGLTHIDLLNKCWNILPLHGRLVANAVTIEGEEKLLSFYTQKGGHISRLLGSRLIQSGKFHIWKSLSAITHYVGIK